MHGPSFPQVTKEAQLFSLEDFACSRELVQLCRRSQDVLQYKLLLPNFRTSGLPDQMDDALLMGAHMGMKSAVRLLGS